MVSYTHITSCLRVINIFPFVPLLNHPPISPLNSSLLYPMPLKKPPISEVLMGGNVYAIIRGLVEPLNVAEVLTVRQVLILGIHTVCHLE